MKRWVVMLLILVFTLSGCGLLEGIRETDPAANPVEGNTGTDADYLSLTAELEQIRQLNGLAAQRGQTLAQMALSWVLRDGIVTSVLAGASRPEQVLDNIKAAQNTSFTPEELALIDRISL